jgi:hypothetical protein
MRSVLVLDEEIGEIAANAGDEQVAKLSDASDTAATLRRLNTALASGQERTSALTRESRTQVVGSRPAERSA